MLKDGGVRVLLVHEQDSRRVAFRGLTINLDDLGYLPRVNGQPEAS